ncbi:hypothetical protein ACVGVM_30080 (plasmid) [Pseudonocardia bannensis]|uniref:Secreted protein n=1 Tax=Pseudonocardia bannensis TaxID=630973 RepID=A0A848DM30_9PSEU|nr:hypothetical protein [Pseudonocardia bannensis]NMH93778.1 hypothetical protein [Pseudonocardia bannensis]
MPRHRHRPHRSAPISRLLAGGVAVVGSALVGLSAPAQAATPDLVPDLAPALTAHNDVEPAPAPAAPYVEPSTSVFPDGDVLNQLRDVAPAGVPAAGLVQSALGSTKIIPN